ncbi:MAG: T9SS C-terminal target domain-containing protein, partial [Ignavibacteria bacterium]|nr:T9SS C-terminal target domain-containing protein [Ignavibacteria bacterium]
TLVNEQLKPGSYEVEWDGDGFASGVYFYSLITEKFVETKRMVLIK